MTTLSKNETDDETIKMVIRSDVTRKKLCEIIDSVREGSIVTITGPRASDELTARLHCAIRCIARQIHWAGERRSEEDWKRLLTAALYGQRVLPSPDGKGFVVLDALTRDMSGSQKWNLLEYVYAWGSENGVTFDEESM